MSPTRAPRPSPTAALATLVLAAALACGRVREVPSTTRIELTVYAASSLRDALAELGATHESASGTKLRFNFGSSGDLARQILAAGQADLFFSADELELGRLEQAGLLEAGTRRNVLSNQLVVIEPRDERDSVFAPPFAPRQLADARLPLLSLANPDTVPAGRYAKAWLERCGVWPAVSTRILPGIDVRAALAAVESGGARAGIVYRTDAARSERVRIVHAVPLDEGPRILYPLGVLAGRPHAREARELAAFLGSREALAVFERHGFMPSTNE